MVGIYKITNKINGKCYIGQSIDIETRWKQHIYEGRVLRHKYKFYLALNHYGIDNFLFEILEECPLDTAILDARECYWIEYYNSYNNGYNSTRGGQGEDSWVYDPQIIRDLWDEGYSFGEIVKIVGCSKGTVQNRLKGYSDYNLSTSHSRGALRAIREGKIIHRVGEQYIFSDTQQCFFSNNIEVHQYTIDGLYITSYPSLSAAARAVAGKNKSGNESNIGRVLNPNNNQKLAYGYQWSKEKVEQLPPVPMYSSKLVRCIETNQIFHSTVEAAKWAGLKSKSGIRECCCGIRQTSGKHPETGEKLHWEYV